MTREEKLMVAYNYAIEKVYYFETDRYYRMDLVHDAVLHLLENPSKLDDIESIKSYIIRCMKNIYSDLFKSPKHRNTLYYSDDNTGVLENILPTYQIQDTEKLVELEAINVLMESKGFRRKSPQNKHKTMFQRHIAGYNFVEIGKLHHTSPQIVEKSIKESRKIINNSYKTAIKKPITV